MVSREYFIMHVFAWSACVLVFWAGGTSAAAAHYDTATPYTPPYNKFQYYASENDGYVSREPPSNSWHMSPSEIFLTGLRTVLDVVRNINKQRANARVADATKNITHNSTAIKVHSSLKNGSVVSGRGFEDYYDEHHHDHETTSTTTTEKPMKQGRYTDPWAGYYDWIINEGSFKFWSVFQLFTAALLLYACLSAIYYAKFNPILPDYNMGYDDYFLERTVGRSTRSVEPFVYPSGLSWINSSTFQFILNAISKHYEEK